ncbi:pumilio and CPL domain-containing protein penguin [Leptinotarsa decemlineata]|uniref:pumilio and CPL domain-containing protein penguin n=1 Tax=Leptinotarsa decemlineata TaxID=7539 RepID=UPI003D30CFC0
MKNNIDMEDSGPPTKKLRVETKSTNKDSSQNGSKFNKSEKTGGPTHLKKAKPKKLLPNGKGKFGKNKPNPEKVEDWTEFKKKKKELKLKRKQSKDSFDVIVRAKKIGEELRRKTLKGGEEKRTHLMNELHNLLKGKELYPKFVLAHDTARLVQWLLKYSTDLVIKQISKELIPVTVDMLQSKYGVHCVKRLLKYGSSETRSQVIDGMLGNAVKLASHAVSASVVEYAFSTWASPTQKQYLIQEFYGDLYKNAKDANVKHIRDAYKNNESLKSATLGATKANLMRILNKSLLDSGLVQSVLCQFLSECSEDDRKEMITQLAPHIVVISNSKDGVRAAMQCIWHGSNKDKKVIIKALKEHIIELSKHEHGHCAVITLLDCMDDTVLLHKIILVDILKNAKDLAVNEWGRKVLLWLVAPGDSTIFHPLFVKELDQGRNIATCKKPIELRRSEILGYSIKILLDLVANDVQFWLSNASLAIEMIAILKSANGPDLELEKAYNSIVDVISNPDWKIKETDKETLGIEHAGMHMLLKKLAKYDNDSTVTKYVTFGECLAKKLNDDMLKVWLKLNRGCFLLIAVFESGSEETQNVMKSALKKQLKLLKKQSTPGAKILLNKI